MKNPVCYKGFFALFLQALYGIKYAVSNNLPAYIDFGSINYLYSYNDKNVDKNFWNYFFEQPSSLTLDDINNSEIIKSKIEDLYPFPAFPFPEFTYSNEYRKNLNSILNKNIKFKEKVKTNIDNISKEFKGKKIIGLHIRRTDHYREYPSVPLSEYKKILIEEKNNFEQFFISTDDQRVIKYFQAEFGVNKVLFSNAFRSENEIPVHKNQEITNKYKLGLDAILDCYSLSVCKKIIITNSCFSYAALVFNPDIDFILL
jgi:hypothetical protein